ncbi:BCCT family transporter [Halobacteriovorax sp. DA5]|uniref:BCCT family transporter n=1 Tax=Halobacteriovorax sp. DA5 TaxID=2067553 RepID=UPI000CD09A8C|nr:BCCT family transporter [Halobacteriovorax sp. DA5]POB13420.1 choline transporter [Halobacteriovorax sp. DA5]
MNKESKSTNEVESTINKNVFFSSAFFILLITAVGSIWPGHLSQFFKGIQAWLIAKTSWVYVLSMGIILFTSLWLMVSRLGDIKLGPDHSEPGYTNLSWFAMLFSAGMGIGLLFFGVAEPIMHFSSPPVGEAQTIESAREAMKITFFHWGLHAWGVYALLAVCLAYFCYRKNLPLLPRSAFYPILGDKVHGVAGDVVDTFAVIGTMFGVATSLGFGVAQVNAGLHYLIGIPQSETIQVILIAIITGMATISVVLGLDGGIKKLSNINLVVAVILLVAVMALGDTVHLFQQYVQNTGSYLSDIIYKTFNLYAYEKKEKWIGGWTLLYWGWWISWSPFVGMFIARISRGRTIREFMIGVLFVPAGFTFLWMTVFGNSAISIALKDTSGKFVEAVNGNVPVALFRFFEYFPFSAALSVLGVLLVVTFFVSSSDSGSLVIDTLASGGQEEPPVWQRIFWAVTEGVVAAILLHSGGLDALQTMTIASAFPMIILLMIAIYCLVKSLRADLLLMKQVQNHTTTIQYEQSNTTWQERLDSLLSHPKFKEADKFLNEVVEPGLVELQEEFKKRGLDARLNTNKKDSISLVIHNEEVEDFKYEVFLRSFEVPEYAPDEEHEKYYRAEVFLLSGGQEYDVFGYTKNQIVADAVTQYEKHFHFLHLSNSELV